ncbi:hypothetical protein BC938DRAFT_473732, partial [Jimgerdemannia flammicorona]
MIVFCSRYTDLHNFSVSNELTGHGISKTFHALPLIYHHGMPKIPANCPPLIADVLKKRRGRHDATRYDLHHRARPLPGHSDGHGVAGPVDDCHGRRREERPVRAY